MTIEVILEGVFDIAVTTTDDKQLELSALNRLTTSGRDERLQDQKSFN